MAGTDKIKTLEKQIAEGLKPLCPECGSRLDIEELKGNTGSKGYNYACLKTNNAHCALPAGTAYLPPHFVIWQAMQQKFVQITLIAIASVALVGAGGNFLGVFDVNFGKEKPVVDLQNQGTDHNNQIDNEKREQKTIDSLRTALSALEKKLAAAEAKEPVLSLEDQQLIWEAELRLGSERYEQPPREYPKSKKYLFAVLDKYSQAEERFSLPETQKDRIMEILADLITKTEFSRGELEKFIRYAGEKKYSPVARRSHHLGIAYYHLAEADPTREVEFKGMSLVNYLQFLRFLIPAKTTTDYDEATLNAINEVFPAMEEDYRVLQNADKVPARWNRRTMTDIRKAVDKKDAGTIVEYARQLNDYLQEQGWGGAGF